MDKLLGLIGLNQPVKYVLNNQLFGDSDGTDTPPTDEPGTPPKGVDETPKFFQKDIDDAVTAARKEWESEQAKKETEAQKLSKMTKEQKEEYQQKKRLEDIEKRESELNKRELVSAAKETLIGKGLPVELAVALDYKDADACNKSIDAIGKVFETAVQKAVEDRIKGTDPLNKSKLGNDDKGLTKESIKNMSAEEINSHWDEIQELMRKGQL